MKTAKHDNPADFTLRPVKTGDTYSKAVDGGFIRAKAASPGVVVVMVDREIFISDTVIAALYLTRAKEARR